MTNTSSADVFGCFGLFNMSFCSELEITIRVGVELRPLSPSTVGVAVETETWKENGTGSSS